MKKEITAKELKKGDEVAISGGTFLTVGWVEIGKNGKSVFYKWEGKEEKNRLGVKSKLFIKC